MAPAPKAKAKAAPVVPTKKTKGAKELRSDYIALRQSPDGLDLDPLTVPKCVECAHCGWPVWPRDSKVATKKTYARAGIERGKKKKKGEGEEGEKGEGEDGEKAEGEEGEEGGSDADSMDTVEELTSQVEELTDKVADLEQDKELLEEQVKDLQTEVENLKEELREAIENIEKLEEAQLWWRDRNSGLRTEIQRHLLYIDRLAMRREHLETDLTLWIAETLKLRKTIQRERRRRALMLNGIEEELAERDRTDVKGLCTRLWFSFARDQRLNRELRWLEQRRQREVFGLQSLNITFWDQKIMLEHWVARLKKRLKDAGLRYLQRCASDSAWPWAKAHVMTAWAGVHPLIFTENRLEDAKMQLGDVKLELCCTGQQLEVTQVQLDETTTDRNRLMLVEESLREDLAYYKGRLDAADAEAAEAALRAEKEKEDAMRRAIAAVEAKLQALRDDFEEEREALENQVKTLEARLAMAEAGGGGADEPWRVVPKGQGILCVGCLNQLVHRSVRPLPPLVAIKESTKPTPQLDKQRAAFFENELGGAMNPDDEIHNTVYMNKKDPYGLRKLNVWPEGVKPPKASSAAVEVDLDAMATEKKMPPIPWPQLTSPDKAETVKLKDAKAKRSHSTPSMRETLGRGFRQKAFR
eukprot:TRINITY_DN23692_c0_g1_i1.p1 TRINITY_DN23692_c0_g1~~TRINITY_DN23692_c0_g1_i1.p1  ORF type:complete len:678 (+),score=195.43 TRINITY_DN23692_c0_g1_i1:115-2034(+)